MNAVKQVGVGNTRPTISIGYVILPSGEVRSDYVARCLRTNTISVFTENNEVLNNIKITQALEGHIVFPNGEGELGSAVVLANIAAHNQPIAVGILPKQDELDDHDEDEVVVGRKHRWGVNEIRQDAKNGRTTIAITSRNSTGGRLDVLLRNPYDSARYNVEVQGEITVDGAGRIFLRSGESVHFLIEDVETDTQTNIMYVAGEGFSYIDEFGNTLSMTDGNVAINGEAIAIGEDGLEPAVKGDELYNQLQANKARLDALIDAITNAVPVPSDGGSALKTAIVAAVSALPSEDYSNIRSSKVSLE